MDAFKQARTTYIAAVASGDMGRIRRAKRALDAAYNAQRVVQALVAARQA